MRYLLFGLIVVLTLFACKKDKYTTAPQVSFKSISPSFVDFSIPAGFEGGNPAMLKFEITDAEGDIGFTPNKDTSYIFVKNLLTNDVDSQYFPNLANVTTKNFKAEITFSLQNVTKCRSLPGNPPPVHVDTIYFEFFVKDFKKNKSNVVKTTTPLLYRCR